MSWPNEADASWKVDFDLAVESDLGIDFEVITVVPSRRGRAHLPELSRVVSRTGPQHAWLSQMRAVSKAVNRHRRFEGSNPSPSASAQNPSIQGRFLGYLASTSTRSCCQSCQR